MQLFYNSYSASQNYLTGNHLNLFNFLISKDFGDVGNDKFD